MAARFIRTPLPPPPPLPPSPPASRLACDDTYNGDPLAHRRRKEALSSRWLGCRLPLGLALACPPARSLARLHRPGLGSCQRQSPNAICFRRVIPFSTDAAAWPYLDSSEINSGSSVSLFWAVGGSASLGRALGLSPRAFAAASTKKEKEEIEERRLQGREGVTRERAN